MLKWAITSTNRKLHPDEHNIALEPKASNQNIGNGVQTRLTDSIFKTSCESDQHCNRQRRKLFNPDLTNIKRSTKYREKENNLTSTRLRLSTHALSPLRKLDSLKDLSNITLPSYTVTTIPQQTPKIQNCKPPDKDTIQKNATVKNNPSQYAATLPTFDVEYSPCGIVPGPILALRGIGVADSYFDQPRYISEKNSVGISDVNVNNEEESLSSSKMGDVTLNRMIDVILESATIERRTAKSKQNTYQIMSPTYTRAEDPASDLNKVWDTRNSKFLQSDGIRKDIQGNLPKVFNEREIKTPECHDVRNYSDINSPNDDEDVRCHLKRQKAVRRKRRLSGSSAVKESVQKLLITNSCLQKDFKLVKANTSKIFNSLSPDSGRNSASDLDESIEDVISIKRRLLFSPAKAGQGNS